MSEWLLMFEQKQFGKTDRELVPAQSGAELVQTKRLFLKIQYLKHNDSLHLVLLSAVSCSIRTQFTCNSTYNLKQFKNMLARVFSVLSLEMGVWECSFHVFLPESSQVLNPF